MAAKLRRYDRLLALSLVSRRAVLGVAHTHYTGGYFDKMIFRFMREPMNLTAYRSLSATAKHIVPDAEFRPAEFDYAVAELRAIIRSMYGDDEA